MTDVICSASSRQAGHDLRHDDCGSLWVKLAFIKPQESSDLWAGRKENNNKTCQLLTLDDKLASSLTLRTMPLQKQQLYG